VEVREEVRQLAQPLAEEEGLELVDVELGFQGRRMLIRVLLDKPGGVTLGDCSRISRRLADCIDMNQTVPGSYQLEVSSPGIERRLPSLASVERFAGQRAAVTLVDAREGRRNWDGVLLAPVDGRVGLAADDGEHWFEWNEIRSVRLIVDPWAGKRNQQQHESRHARRRREATRPVSGEERHEQ
jgi:ribosome maturation factor RimP